MTRSGRSPTERIFVVVQEEAVCRMGVVEIRPRKQLEKENARLNRLVADLTLDKSMLQDVLRRKW